MLVVGDVDGWVATMAASVVGNNDAAAGCVARDEPAAGKNEEEEDSSSIDARRCTGKGACCGGAFRIILIRLRAFWGCRNRNKDDDEEEL